MSPFVTDRDESLSLLATARFWHCRPSSLFSDLTPYEALCLDEALLHVCYRESEDMAEEDALEREREQFHREMRGT